MPLPKEPLPRRPRPSQPPADRDNPMLDEPEEDQGLPTQKDIVGTPGESAFTFEDDED